MSRHPLVADALEDRVGCDAIFDQRAVAVAAEGIKAGEDVGDLMLDLVVAKHLPRHGLVATLEAVGDHQNAVTAGTLRRLDDEIVVVADDVLELLDIPLSLDHPVHFRHVDARLDGALLGDDLVVDDRIQMPLVVLEHVVRITPVDAHDAFGFKGLPRLDQAEHGLSP